MQAKTNLWRMRKLSIKNLVRVGFSINLLILGVVAGVALLVQAQIQK